MLIGIKMKFQKTYKDFVNEIISEAGSDPDATIKKQIKGLSDAINGALEKSFKKHSQNELRDIMRTYVNCFITLQGDKWNDFISLLVSSCAKRKQFIDEKDPKKGIWCTKFQFMYGFFDYYFKKVFKFKKGYWAKGIQKCLKECEEIQEMDKDTCSLKTINEVINIYNHGQKHKKLFVSIFNSLKRGY